MKSSKQQMFQDNVPFRSGSLSWRLLSIALEEQVTALLSTSYNLRTLFPIEDCWSHDQGIECKVVEVDKAVMNLRL